MLFASSLSISRRTISAWPFRRTDGLGSRGQAASDTAIASVAPPDNRPQYRAARRSAPLLVHFWARFRSVGAPTGPARCLT